MWTRSDGKMLPSALINHTTAPLIFGSCLPRGGHAMAWLGLAMRRDSELAGLARIGCQLGSACHWLA